MNRAFVLQSGRANAEKRLLRERVALVINACLLCFLIRSALARYRDPIARVGHEQGQP